MIAAEGGCLTKAAGRLLPGRIGVGRHRTRRYLRWYPPPVTVDPSRGASTRGEAMTTPGAAASDRRRNGRPA